MLLGSIQIHGENLTDVGIKDICDSLESHAIRLLSLRECYLHDKDFKKLMRCLSQCKSLLQLNMNLGVVNSVYRADLLASALMKNRALHTLFLHGSPIGDEGIISICKGLLAHPNIISLDLGDCLLGDKGLAMVCELLPPNGAKPGLQDLTLSANPGITARGWAHFCIALSVSNSLKTLNLDYNNLYDYGAGCLAVALTNCKLLETIDLEGTGITEHGAKVFLMLVRNFPVALKHMVLSENDVNNSTVTAILECLEQETETDADTATETYTETSETTDVAPTFIPVKYRYVSDEDIPYSAKSEKQFLKTEDAVSTTVDTTTTTITESTSGIGQETTTQSQNHELGATDAITSAYRRILEERDLDNGFISNSDAVITSFSSASQQNSIVNAKPSPVSKESEAEDAII